MIIEGPVRDIAQEKILGGRGEVDTRPRTTITHFERPLVYAERHRILTTDLKTREINDVKNVKKESI